MNTFQNILYSYFRFVKRFLPARHPGGVVGLDLGASACRAVEIVENGFGFEVTRYLSVPIEGADENSALKKVFEVFGKTEHLPVFVAALSGRGTLVRYVDMPRMSLSDLKKAFAIEADKYFPFPKETIYIDCHILDSKNTEKKMPVLIAAVKRGMADQRFKALKDAGLEPSDLTMNAVALANAFTCFPPANFVSGSAKESRAAVLVDIGEIGTNLIVFVEGLPCFSRDIFIGVNEIVKRVANACGFTQEDARSRIFSSGEKNEALQKALETVAANLVSELRLSFDYFVNEKNTPIGQMFLVGEGVLVPGLEVFFAGAFDFPLVVWDPFSKLSLGPLVNKENIAADARSAITALGLALNEYHKA